jgi:hypothetical protein
MKTIIRLSDKELRMIRDIEDITGVDYDIEGNTIEPISLLSALYELKFEYDSIKQEFEEYKDDIENDNYISNDGIDREEDYFERR